MAGPGPRWVLCGGATHPHAPADALRLGLGPGDWHALTVNIEGIEERMSGSLSDVLRDLVRIAAFVFAADCGTPRGSRKAVDNGATWRRDFRFVVPVTDPDFWNQPGVRGALCRTLGFLSDDRYAFHFVGAGRTEAGRQLRFQPPGDRRTLVPWDGLDEVMLFSGGMDSFAGAAEAVLVRGWKVLLVSHRSSPQMQKVQGNLVRALAERVRGGTPWHVGVEVHRHDKALRKEETQRSRSFLFASIAGAVAWLAGRRRVRFHENGVIALNLPITPQLVGARGTRTVHPRVLDGFAELLALVTGEAFEVDNPYQWLTRADVAERIRDAGARDLLRHTRSCAGVRHASKMHPYCGVCSQCVDRQFAVRAAGMLRDDPEEMYATNIFRDPLGRDQDVQLALGYVSAAETFRSLATPQELVSRYGEVVDALPHIARRDGISHEEARARILDLHQRQGRMVMDVLAEEFKRQAADLVAGRLHPASLLMRCSEEGQQAAREAYGLGAAGTTRVPEDTPRPPPTGMVDALVSNQELERDTFVEAGDFWVVGLAGTKAVGVKASKGMPLIRAMLRSPGHTFNVLELEAVARGEPAPSGTPGDMPTMDAAYLASVKQRIQELRAEEEEADEMGDTAAATRFRAERERLEEQILAETRLGGAPRKVPPEVEKAKDRVSKAIRRALKEIKRVHLPLGRHLAQAIHQGYRPTYTGQRTWVTDR